MICAWLLVALRVLFRVQRMARASACLVFPYHQKTRPASFTTVKSGTGMEACFIDKEIMIVFVPPVL